MTKIIQLPSSPGLIFFVAVTSVGDLSHGFQSAPTGNYVGAQHFGSTESNYSVSTAFSSGLSIVVALDFGQLIFDAKCNSDPDRSASLIGTDLNLDLAPPSRDLYFGGCWLIVISGTDVLSLPWLQYYFPSLPKHIAASILSS